MVVFLVEPKIGIVAFAITLLVPSRQKLAQRELDRRLGEFRAAIQKTQFECAEEVRALLELRRTLDLNDDELGHDAYVLAHHDRRLKLEAFEAEVKRVGTSSSEAIDRLLLLPAQLEIADSDAAPLIEELHAKRDILLLEAASSGKLEEIPDVRSVFGPEPCYFCSPVFLDKHGKDESGMVYLGAIQLLFVASSRVAFRWDKVSAISRNLRTLTIARSDRQNPYHFVFDSVGIAVKAERIANKIRDTARS